MRGSFFAGGLLATAFAVLLAGCVGAPEGVEPVRGFDVGRYMGRWYEIARLDHRFERGLEQVTATYAPNPDGTVSVLNRGFDPDKGEWSEAEGKAEFVGTQDVGALKVSFFGPFYGAYNVIELDPDYQYALVVGPNRSYLWILARAPSLPDAVTGRLVAKAKALGFDTSNLIYVRQCASGEGGANCGTASR
jgi:apolipoprotein D and lipocalin family protein